MANDPRIDTLIDEMACVKKEVRANAVVVQEVREILGSFKIIAQVAKWLTTIAAGAAVIYAFLHGVTTFFDHKP